MAIRNLLYLHCHDAGRYIEPYGGHRLQTPNLVRLAREGTLFRQAFCAGPTCSPSRVGLLTGMSPHAAGMLGLAHRGFNFGQPDKHLAQFLKDRGFQTALCGAQHEFNQVVRSPYEHQPQIGGGLSHRAGDVARADLAAKFLRSERDPARRFFLSVGFVWPHRAFDEIDSDIEPDLLRPPAPLPDCAATRRDMAGYATAVRAMDHCCGIVLGALRETGLEGETLVVFTTDHGVAFPAMKCNLTDHGLGVSLILKYPGNPHAGRATDAMVSHLDLFPTFCELLGLEKPDWLEGTSLRPVLEGKAEQVREELFGEVTYHAAYEPQRAIRTRRHKLIRIFDEDLARVPANCDDGLSKELWADAGYYRASREPVQLYDLLFDPNETRNLAGDPGHADVLADLQARLEAWMRRTGDPLLHGPVHVAGAKVNPRQHYSASEPPETI